MGLFSVFSKQKPEEVYRSIAQKFVVASLRYRQDISAPNNKVSADAGAEMIYLLLHILDRQVFGQLGASHRDIVFDEVTQIAVEDYASAILNEDAPEDLLISIISQMMSTLSSRQSIYGQCESLTGESWPSKSTIIFAFCFFIHRALGHTVRNDVDDILSGIGELSESDVEDFPDPLETIETAQIAGTLLDVLQIQNDLKQLK